MKVAIIGDLHLSLIDKRPWLDTKLIKSTWERMMKAAKRRGCFDVILLGDVHDSYNPSKEADRLLFELLLPHARTGTKFHIIAGNHDFGRDGSCSLDFLESMLSVMEIDNINVYKEPTVKCIEGVYFNFLPYPNKTPYLEHSPCINIAHVDKVDAKYHNDYRVKETAKNVSPLDGHIWWLGHIHRRQNLGVDKTTRYVGTPWQASWMEKHADCSFTIADLSIDDDELNIDYTIILTKPDFQIARFKPETQKELDAAHKNLAKALNLDPNKMNQTFVFVEVSKDLVIPQHKWSYAESIVQIKGSSKNSSATISKAIATAKETDDLLDFDDLDTIENVLYRKLEEVDESPRVKARAKVILEDILKSR